MSSKRREALREDTRMDVEPPSHLKLSSSKDDSPKTVKETTRKELSTRGKEETKEKNQEKASSRYRTPYGTSYKVKEYEEYWDPDGSTDPTIVGKSYEITNPQDKPKFKSGRKKKKGIGYEQ